jgi:hypothetical protein
VQPAAAWQGAEVFFRRLHSRQNHWLGFAGQAKGAPDLEGKLCAALSPGPRRIRLRMVSEGVVLGAQQRQILHRGRPAVPVRGLVMSVQ